MDNKAIKRDVDIILVEDDDVLAESIIEMLNDRKIDIFLDPTWLLKSLDRYSKQVKICLDYTYPTGSYTGIEVAEILYNHGFTNLYLHSGHQFEPGDIPEYLTVIVKGDIDALCNYLHDNKAIIDRYQAD